MACFAGLLHRLHSTGDLLGTVDALGSNEVQVRYGGLILTDALGEAVGVGPDFGQRSIGLRIVLVRFRKMLPGGVGQSGQLLCMAGESFAIKGQTSGEHAAHGFAVLQKLLEHGLALAFGRIRVGLLIATGRQQ